MPYAEPINVGCRSIPALRDLNVFDPVFSPSPNNVADGPRTPLLPNQNLVLVVDDDPGMRKGIHRLLRQFAYDALLFPSAEAFKNHTDFEQAVCVLLDINLKDGSGIELRQDLNAAGVSVPVIYITGNETPAVRKAALDSGCIAFLTKPFLHAVTH